MQEDDDLLECLHEWQAATGSDRIYWRARLWFAIDRERRRVEQQRYALRRAADMARLVAA